MNAETHAADGTSPARRRSGCSRAAWWLGVLPLVLVAVPVAVLLWAGIGRLSAARIAMAQRFNAGRTTSEFTGAQGSVTGGGRIGHVEWSAAGTTLAIDDLRLDWSLRDLLHRDLRVQRLSMRRLHLRRTPQPAQPAQPFTMPADLTLPIRLTVPLDIARIEIESIDEQGNASVQVIQDLAAHYRYDGGQHALRLDSLHYGSSRLQADARLHATTLALRRRLMDAARTSCRHAEVMHGPR